MRRGGNAVDAAVTCAFVQGVIDPQMCGIGGCGVMLVHSPQAGDTLLEFYGTAGSRVREDQWESIFIREAADRYGYVLEGWLNDVGYQSVCVPGTVAGLHEALKRFGTISWEDLETYRVNVTEPIRGTYRDLQVTAAGPPAGGLTLLQMLNFLEGYDIGAAGWPSTEAARLLVEAMAWAVADREMHIADPRFVDLPVGALADKQYAAKPREVIADRADTTQICVVDDGGNAVSLTHTLGSASGVVTPGLGFGYNDYMNCFDPRPGRPNSVRPG